MKAALFHENGGPDVIRIEDVAEPVPGPAEAKVSVAASSLNHLDLWVRRGLPIETTMPHIGGSDIAGVVDSVGSPEHEEWVGRRVVVDPSLGFNEFYVGGGPPMRLIGEHTDGGFAEFVVVPVANLVALPDDVTAEVAAAAALTFVTAWHALTTQGGVGPGSRVLVTGASGGVATAAIQLAKALGAEVFALTKGSRSLEQAARLGADFVYDRSDGDFVGSVRRDSGKRGVNVIVDSVGEALWSDCLRVLGVGGTLVCYGATSGPKVSLDLRHVFWKQLTFRGATMGSPAEFREAMGFVFRNEAAPVIEEVLPLEKARSAHERLEAGSVVGKLVLTP